MERESGRERERRAGKRKRGIKLDREQESERLR